MNQIIQGDCLEVLRGLPDNSINLICTDPPYFKVKGKKRDADGNDFEWWDKQWDKPTKFLEWLDSIAAEWQRVLKPNGSLYCFASPKMSARVEVLLGDRFNVLNNIRWVKDEGWHKKADKDISRLFHSPWESIIFCEHYGADNIAKGEAGYGAKCDELRGFVFEPLRAYLDGERQRAGLNPDQVNVLCGFREKGGMAGRHWFSTSQFAMPTASSYAKIQSACPGYFTRPYEELRQQYEELRQQYEELRQQYEELRRPFNVTADVPYTDVWTFPTVSHYPGKHPCEKPLAMMEHIINASSRPNDVVLDCFAGSGSTLSAAKKNGRQFIGIEIDPHWADVARGKVGQTQKFISIEDRVQWLETQIKGMKAKGKRQAQLSIFDIA